MMNGSNIASQEVRDCEMFDVVGYVWLTYNHFLFNQVDAGKVDPRKSMLLASCATATGNSEGVAETYKHIQTEGDEGLELGDSKYRQSIMRQMHVLCSRCSSRSQRKQHKFVERAGPLKMRQNLRVVRIFPSLLCGGIPVSVHLPHIGCSSP